MFSKKSNNKKTKSSSGKLSRKDNNNNNNNKGGNPGSAADDYSTICMTLFVFRGQPDVYYKRHVLVYFTSPEYRHFHETVHVQRDNDTSPWTLDQIHTRVDWSLSGSYRSHVNAGAVRVWKGDEMMPVNIVASTPVQGREQDSGWNCQNFILEGLQEIVNSGLQTEEWYESVEEELMEHLFEGSVG